MLVFPLWVDPWFWFVVRLLFGCGGALLFVLSEAAVNALTPDAIRGRVLGIYATLFSIGYAGGPVILGLAGSEGWTPFILASALFASGLVPAGMLRRVEARLAPAHGGNGHRLVDTWRVAPIAMAGVFVYAVLEASQFALLPIYALARGMGEGAAAGLLSVWISGNILLQYPLGWLGDRWSRPRVMLLCAVIAVAGQLMVSSVVAVPALLWPLLVLLGGVMGGLYTLALTLVGERFRGADLTQANTAFVMTFQLGAIAGPPYAGALMQAGHARRFPAGAGPAAAAAGGGPAGARASCGRPCLDRTPLDRMLRAPTSCRIRGLSPMAKPTTVLIKLVSTAGTGFFYTTKKNPRKTTEKLTLRKYDPKVRKHVEFKEAKIK